jgi:hypothetical protein
MKKLRAGYIQGVHAVIQVRIFCISSFPSETLKIRMYETIILLVLYGCKTLSLILGRSID